MMYDGEKHRGASGEMRSEERVEVIPRQDASSNLQDGDDDSEEAIYWDAPTWINMGALCYAYFASTFTVTIPPGAIAYIAARFPGESSSAAWIATSMTMVSTIVILPLGEFIDIFGRKKTILACLAIAFAGMIVIGRATSIKMVIIGQALDGLGLAVGYMIQPILYEIVPKRHRPLTGAISGITSGTGFIIAPIIEGLCIKNTFDGPLNGWRTGMYIGAALYGSAFFIVLFGYYPTPRTLGKGLNFRQRLFKMDWLAVFLLAAGLALFLTGLGIGGNLHPWDSAATLCLIIIGFVLLVATVVRICYTKEGLLPHSLFRHRNFGIALGVRATGSFAQLGCQAFLPQVVVYLFETDGILQAVWALPFSVALIGGALVAAPIFWWTKEGRWLAMAAMATLSIGAGTMTLIDAQSSFIQWMWPPLIMGLSVGIEAQVLNVIAALATPDEYIATAVSAASLCATFGSSIGITIFNQIFSSKLKTLLPAYVTEAVLAAGLPASSVESLLIAMGAGDPTAYATIPGVTPDVLAAMQVASKNAYAKSFTYIWYALLAFALVTMAAAGLFKTTKPQMTAEVSSPVKGTLITRLAEQRDREDGETARNTSEPQEKSINQHQT